MDPLEIIAIVSVATAALFWIVTQWNIVHTKNVLKAFQVEARTSADQKIDAAFLKIEALMTGQIAAIKLPTMPDLDLLNRDIKLELETLRSEIPDLEEIEVSIMTAVNGQLTQLGPALTTELAGAMAAQLKSYDREKTRQLGQQLSKFGIAIEETGEAIKGDLIAQSQEGVSPVQIALMNFLGQKVSPAYAEENPGAAMFFNLAKVQAVQFMQSQGLTPAGDNKALTSKAHIQSGKSGLYG